MKTVKGFARFGERLNNVKDNSLDIRIDNVFENGFEYVVRYEKERRNNK